MVKILRTFLLGISVLLTLNINAQATYIRPCYSINAGLDSSICAINCVTINRTAIPQYLNKATNTYVVQQMTMPSPLYNNTGTNVIVNTDDVWSGIVNIGFNFCYFGNTYNKLVIGANGIISFNTAYANAYCPWSYTGGIPDATKPINSIMGVYTDVDPSVGFNANRINYYTEGVAPCRRFVINYYRVPMFSCNSLLYTTQIVLHEAYNIIDVIVVNKPVCSSWNGGRGIIGIQNAAGNTAFSAPGNNPSTSAISNQCWRFIPNGALMQSVSWYQGATQVSNTDVLSASLCPTSSTVFEARLLNTRCDGSSVTVTDTVRFNVNLGGANAGVDKTLSCITPNITIGTPAQPNTNYTWTPGAGLSNPNIAQPSTNTPNTYILTATNTITGCSAKDTVIVGPKTFPVADAGPNKTITCANPSIQIGTTYVPGIFYAWSPATGLSSTSTAQPLASQPRMYYLTVTDSATGCTGTDSVMVTIDTIRPTADAGLDKSISCTFPNAQIGTSAIAGNSYTWLPPTGLSNPNIAQPIASSGGTYTLTVTKNSNGCTATDNVLITADTIKPTANAGLDDTITCSVPSIVLGTTAVAGNSYVWSPPLGLNNPNIAQPTASQPNTYTLTVTKNANGCTATDAVTILRDTVKPVANAGRDSLLTCAVLSIPIGTTALPGMNYSWTPSGGLSSSSSAQPNASQPNTYTVTVTNPVNGCSKSDAVVITQNIIKPVANAGRDSLLTCVVSSIPIGAAPIGGMTYIWNPGGGLSSNTIANPVTTQPATFIVTVKDTFNQCTAKDTVIITRDITLPTANAGLDDTITCSVPSIVLGTTAVAGNSYVWSPPLGLNNPNIAQPTASQPNTYTLTVTKNANGCTATDAVTILRDTVKPLANAGRDSLLTCAVLSIPIGTTALPGMNYSWMPSGGLSSTSSAQPNASQPNTYTVTVTNPVNGCSKSDAVVITQNIIKPVANAGRDSLLTCVVTAIPIGSAPVAGMTYTWNPGGGLSSNTIANPVTTQPATFIVTVKDTFNQCTAKDTVVITRDITLPTANAGLDDTITCSVPSIVLGTTAVAGNSYVWSPPLGLNNPNIAQPTASQPNTYTLTVTKNANGCTATDAVTILRDTVKPLANAGRDSLLTCAVLSIPIGTTALPGMNYSWTPSGGLSSSSSAQPNASQPNTYTVTVTNPVNGCSKSDAVVITQNIIKPVANAGRDSLLTCVVSSIPIGAAPIGGMTYIWNPGGGLSSNTIANPVTTQPATFIVTVKDTFNQCTAKDTVVITRDITLPTANAGLDDTITCSVPSIVLGTTAVAGNSYVWSPPLGLNNPNIAQPTASQPNTYTLTVTKNANGCTATDAVTILRDTVKPVANAGRDSLLTCAVLSIPIGTTALPGMNYSWTPSGGLSSSSSVQPNASQPNTYTVTVTNPVNGCSKSDAVVITQNIIKPVANAGRDSLLTCVVSSIPIGAAPIGGMTYIWNPGGGLSSNTIANPVTTQPATFIVTVKDTFNQCTAKDTVVITRDITLPTANAGLDDTITCSVPSIVLGTTAVAGNSYVWSPPLGLNNPNIAQPTASQPNTYTLTVTKNANGCTATDAVTILRDTVKPVANAGRDSLLTCAVLSIPIGTTALPGMNYSWTPSGGLSSSSNAQPNASQPNTYTVTATNTTNGCTATDQVVISQNITPPVANAGVDKTLTCTTTSVILGTTAQANTTYSWSPASGLSGTAIAQPNASQPNTYTLTATNTTNGCTKSDVVIVSQNITPPPANAGADKIITCAQPKVSIGVSTGNFTYSWSPSTGLTSPNTAVTLSDSVGTFGLTVTNPVNGCFAVDSVTITIDTIQPVADAGEDIQFTCPISPVTIGSPDNPILRYVWNNTYGISATNIAQPTADTAGIFVVRVQSTINGCWSKTDSVTVYWKNCACDVFVPDAFSPNGDGVNDVVKPLKNCDDISNLMFRIFNRWGEQVYQSESFDEGWNGFFKSEAQQMDSYIWTISYHDVLYNKDVFLKGVVTLVR